MTKFLTMALVMGFAPSTYGFFNFQRTEIHAALVQPGVVQMEAIAAAVPKPKVSYAQFLSQQVKHQPGTVANVIEKFIVEMNGLDGRPPVRTIGETNLYTLRRLQKSPIGAVDAFKMSKHDLFELCKARRAEGCCPATVSHDTVNLEGVFKYAGSAWAECDGLTVAAFTAAKPFLIKHNLIGKSTPRHQRATDEQAAQISAWFAANPGNKIDMVRVYRWQGASSRRISETCRIQWADWNRDEHTMLVRKMKDPRNRDKNKLVALPEAAQAILVEMWESRDPNEPRIFPYRAASCSARHTAACKALGIENLHLHDSRRDCYTRLVEDEGYSLEEAILVTGHETIAIPQRTYLAMKPELFKLGPKAKRIGNVEQLGMLERLKENATRLNATSQSVK